TATSGRMWGTQTSGSRSGATASWSSTRVSIRTGAATGCGPDSISATSSYEIWTGTASPRSFLTCCRVGHTAASTRSSTDTSDPRGPIGSGRTFGGIPDTASATLTTAAYRSSFQGTTA